MDIFALVHQKTIEPLGTNAPVVWFGGNSLLPVEASSMLKSRQTNRRSWTDAKGHRLSKRLTTWLMLSCTRLQKVFSDLRQLQSLNLLVGV